MFPKPSKDHILSGVSTYHSPCFCGEVSYRAQNTVSTRLVQNRYCTMIANFSKQEAEVEIDLACNTLLLHHPNEFRVATFFFPSVHGIVLVYV